MNQERRLTKADLVELPDIGLIYAESPDLDSPTTLPREIVANLFFSLEADGLLYLEFEQEEGIITSVWYRGNYFITKKRGRDRVG